jgi:hypothetical protein
MGNSKLPPKLKFWPLFFLLSLAEEVLSFVSLVLIPREMESGVLFGFSRTRLAIMAALLLALAALAGLAWLSGRRPDWTLRWLDPRRRPRFFAWLHVMAVAGMLAAGFGLFWLRFADPDRLMALFIRARPPLVFGLVFCAQLALWLLILRNEAQPRAILPRRGVYAAGLIAFAAFLAVAVLVAVTGLGITPDPGYWSQPGVPLLGWQAALAVICGALILLLGLKNWIANHGRLFDLFLGLGLWALAVAIWMSVPLAVLKDSYYAPIQPPYTVPFPYSDAGMYDYLSRALLLGNGFGTLIPPRPLYIVFLAGIHAVFGNSYAGAVLGQTLVLALFPAVLYFLGKKLHSRAAGLTIGLLAIFRELTTLWVSAATVSNSKIFLSDLPTALAAAAFLLLAVHWLTKRERRPFDAFLVGGMFGLLLLLRVQIVFALGGLTLAGRFAARCPWKRWLAHAAVFAAGMILAVAPWLVRNWMVSGRPGLDDPAQMRMVAALYANASPYYTGEDIADMTPSEAARTVVGVIVHQPGYVARFVTAHFLANEIDTLLVLPLSEEYAGIHAPVNLYWFSWDGHPTWQNTLVVLLYLALLGIGIGAAWRQLGWAGLLPLLFNLFYSLSNGVARISGWRYILPMDWVGYFYFGLGVIELLAGLALIFGGKPSRLFAATRADLPPATQKPARFMGWKTGAATLLVVLVGGLPLIMEHAIPPHFPSTSADALLARLAASPAARSAGVDAAEVQSFATQPNALFVTGRLLYPRFLEPDLALHSSNPWPAYAGRNYARMGFILLTRQGVFQAVLPVDGMPGNFPPDQDVILLGCDRGNYVEGRLLLFLPDVYFSGGSLAEGCDIR